MPGNVDAHSPPTPRTREQQVSLHELAASQHGLVTRRQLAATDMPSSTISDWVRQGRLRRVRPGVFATPGVRSSDLQRLLAAVLAAGEGATASHRAAAWLWELADDPVLEVTVPRSRHPRLSGVVVHRPLDGSEGRSSIRRGIPVTNPLRTLCDLGSVVSAEAVGPALERALTARLVSPRGLRTAAEAARATGRRGAGYC